MASGRPGVVEQQNRLSCQIIDWAKALGIELTSFNGTSGFKKSAHPRLERPDPPSQLPKRRMLVSRRTAGGNDRHEVKPLDPCGPRGACLVVTEEAPQNRCQSDRRAPADRSTLTVLVISKGGVHLTEPLAVGDRYHGGEIVRLEGARVTARVVGIDESPADFAHGRDSSGDIPHRPLVGTTSLLDPNRHPSSRG